MYVHITLTGSMNGREEEGRLELAEIMADMLETQLTGIIPPLLRAQKASAISWNCCIALRIIFGGLCERTY